MTIAKLASSAFVVGGYAKTGLVAPGDRAACTQVKRAFVRGYILQETQARRKYV